MPLVALMRILYILSKVITLPTITQLLIRTLIEESGMFYLTLFFRLKELYLLRELYRNKEIKSNNFWYRKFEELYGEQQRKVKYYIPLIAIISILFILSKVITLPTITKATEIDLSHYILCFRLKALTFDRAIKCNNFGYFKVGRAITLWKAIEKSKILHTFDCTNEYPLYAFQSYRSYLTLRFRLKEF